ncbi:MAG TPA: dephospho-CoA kinase [Longimicrobiales bacterium]
MRRVALTGNIASGKSAVADIWERLGAYIVDADVLARRAVEPGSPGLRRIEQAFGSGVIRDGELDRAALRGIVFADDEKRAALEAIVHPEVERLRREEETRVEAAGERVIVHVIPLLFEAELVDRFDTIVLVDADERVRRERIMRTRGLGREEADAMIRAQIPAAAKRARADHIIDNNAGLEELTEAAERTWNEIVAGAR